MIIYCTSVTVSYDYISHYAHALSREMPYNKVLGIPGNLIPREQLQYTEDHILRLHEKNPKLPFIVHSTYELPILRILRRIREAQENGLPFTRDNNTRRWIDGADFLVHHVNTKEPADILRVGKYGEFMNAWPDGFFDERMEELF